MLPLTVDRYIASRVIVPLASTFGIGLAFLLAERVVGLLDNTMGKGNVLFAVLEMLAYLSPYYVGLAIPVALFLGVLLGFNRLSRDNEIAAFSAAGIGLHRLSLPVAYLSIASLMASIAVVGWLQPHGRYAYRSALFAIQNIEIFYLAEEGVFMQAGTRTFIFDRLDRSDSKAFNVFIYDDRGSAGATTTLTAQEGQLIDVEGQIRPTLRLQNGLVMKLDPRAEEEPTAPRSLTVSEFAVADTPIGRLSDKVFRQRGIDERELTLVELVASQAHPPSGSSVLAMQAELHNRLVRMLTIPFLPFLAIPFALARNRAHRAYNLGSAMILLFAYNHFIEQGTIATISNGASIWTSVWMPFALLVAFTAFRFWSACFAMRRERLEFLSGWTGKAIAAWRRPGLQTR